MSERQEPVALPFPAPVVRRLLEFIGEGRTGEVTLHFNAGKCCRVTCKSTEPVRESEGAEAA